MIAVGVTGGIASGKSTLVRVWERRGAPAIDADRVGWEVLARAEVRESILYAFGPDVLGEDGEVDRAALARKAFADEETTGALEAILHPPILARIDEWIGEERRAGRAPAAVVEASLLLEAGAADRFDYVVVVTAPEAVRLARLEAKGIPRADAVARMKRQWTDDKRAAFADYLLANDGEEPEFAAKASRLWDDLLRLPPRGPEERAHRKGITL